jgi:8-oxo-dGTP diphosphatase
MDAGIAAAVITYSARVLLIRRAVAEGALSWQFPAGKVLPGETAEEGAVREAAEEAGVEVTAARLLGERVHPGTGARVTYVACAAADGTARVASAREVAEVRWVSPEEADELTGGTVYEPVREYLRRVAGGLQGAPSPPVEDSAPGGGS